ITGSGVYVQLDRFLVEGMVRTQDMPQAGGRPDHWQADDRTGRLVAKRSGASLGVGDIVMVEIQRVDLGSRHLDLRLTELPRQPDRATASPPKEKRKGKKGYKQGRRGRRSR
ncbi:MAG: hypothetical protein ACYTAQ_06885, partial [Planctomycetota bacterium]